MSNQLTNSEKAKAIVMYLGCDVNLMGEHEDEYKDPPIPKIFKLNGVIKYQDEEIFCYCDDNEYHHEPAISDVFLLLTPLAKISDEHILQLGKLLIDSESEDFKLVGRYKDETLFWFKDKYSKTGYSYLDICTSDSNIEVGVIDPENVGKREQLFECGSLLLQAYDLLREWGYMVHYKEQSLFELGIAIEKQ